MNFTGIMGWFSPTRWIILAVVATTLTASFYGWRAHERSVYRDEGRKEVRLQWEASVSQQRAVALAESEANAKESFRRIEKQQENQNAQTVALAAARADAVRNDAAAGELREQLAVTAKRWRDALDHSPTGADGAAAADAIGVLADVLGRADKRAGILAAYADAARTAGAQCERNYDALTQLAKQ